MHVWLSLFILMDYAIHINTINMELSILYSKGLLVKISIKWCISVPEDLFILANSENHDEMSAYAAFHLGVHCLPKYPFTGFQNEKGYVKFQDISVTTMGLYFSSL